MSTEMIVQAPFTSKLGAMAAVIGIGSIPVLWVFTHPVNEETPVAFVIALAAPVLVYIYMTFRHVVKIRNNQLILPSFLLIPHKPIDISKIESITSHRSFRNTSLDIKLHDAHYMIPAHAFEFEQSLGIIHALKTVNPGIHVPSELKKLVEVFDDKQSLKIALEEFKRVESNKMLKIIAVATASVLCIWLYKVSKGDEYSLRQLVDLFISWL